MNVNKGTKAIISIMIVLVFIGVSIAYFYYGSINEAEDPRVIEAKYQYKSYNEFVSKNDFKSVFATLDTIENIYLQFSDYKKSYELAVVYNNKAATWLTLALQETANEENANAEFDSAKLYSEKSVLFYENWLKEFQNLSKKEILIKIEVFYDKSNNAFEGKNIIDIIEKRAVDIVKSQKETLKRLSVAYTNLGIIQRHKLDYDNAMISYKKALGLWEGNRSAQNNINILLGRPIEEMTTFERVFPEENEN